MDKQYYEPGTRGAERDYADRYTRLKKIVRGE
jgi:putative ATPase